MFKSFWNQRPPLVGPEDRTWVAPEDGTGVDNVPHTEVKKFFNIACPVKLPLILFNRGQQRPQLYPLDLLIFS